MKERDTSILFGLLILVSFCMGHACVNVHAFWTEPVILWVACAINNRYLRVFSPLPRLFFRFLFRLYHRILRHFQSLFLKELDTQIRSYPFYPLLSFKLFYFTRNIEDETAEKWSACICILVIDLTMENGEKLSGEIFQSELQASL